MRNTIAFCIGEEELIKHAALFYDSVFSVPFEAVKDLEEPAVLSSQASNQIFEIVPANIFNEISGVIYPIMSDPYQFGMDGLEFANYFATEILFMHEHARRLSRGEALDEEGLSNATHEWLKQKGFESAFVSPVKFFPAEGSTEDDFFSAINGLSLIDTKTASWEQILEVRRSEELCKKLRNLRLFFYTNYKNKPISFIEDDLEKRIDDYNSVVKDLGFETATSSITMLLNSKSLGAFGVAAAAALYAGQPAAAAAAITGGVSVEIGKLTLELAKKRHAFKKHNKDHDLAYLIDVEKKLER